MFLPDEVIKEIADRTDIEQLIGRYVTLQRAGSRLKGLCPFHHEKTPSFTVSPDKGVFHCFGCKKGGNAFKQERAGEALTGVDFSLTERRWALGGI